MLAPPNKAAAPPPRASEPRVGAGLGDQGPAGRTPSKPLRPHQAPPSAAAVGNPNITIFHLVGSLAKRHPRGL